MNTKTIATTILALAFLASGARAAETPAQIGTSIGVLMAIEAMCGENALTAATRKGYDRLSGRYVANADFWNAALKSMASYSEAIEADPRLCVMAAAMQP